MPGLTWVALRGNTRARIAANELRPPNGEHVDRRTVLEDSPAWPIVVTAALCDNG